MKNKLNLTLSLFLSFIGLVISGMVVKYGWNNFITKATTFPTINLFTAIGVDLTITYITGHATPRKLEDIYSSLNGLAETMTIFTIGLTKSLMTLIVMHLITFFI